jgi:uncharacterized protein (DUF362 family)
MNTGRIEDFDRRDFLKQSMVLLGAMSVSPLIEPCRRLFSPIKPVVSIVKIKDGKVAYAIEKAIDLLGGIQEITMNKEKIMLKPNLVSDNPRSTTKPEVVKTLAKLMKTAGKEVVIGEGSAAAVGINADENGIYYTRKEALLNRMQQQIFDKLGYSSMANELGIPLINLHTGELVEVEIEGAHHFKKLTIHKSLMDIDLLCSVPMMKTHSLATVTLGMKNLIGLYPGTAYCSVRSCIHIEAEENGSPGIAYEILDMVKANKLGLTVIDGSTAMEGNGPSDGQLVDMDLIIAGTNPLATDMVAADTMGFEPHEVPTFAVAHQSGMQPCTLTEIEVRGEPVDSVRRNFQRPVVVPFKMVKDWFGAKEV